MLRKNTAGQVICFSGINASTGAALTGATFSCRRCLDGTFAAATGSITEDTGLGFYKMALSQADTNGNNCSYFFTATNAIPVTINVITTVLDPTSTAFGLSIAKTTNITGFNDIAATAIVSGGAITTSGGAVSTVTTATNVTTVNGLAAGVITAASIAADAITDAKVAADVTIASVTGAVGSVTGNVGGNVVGSVGSVTGSVGGNVTGSVGSVTAAVTVGTINAGVITAAAIATDAIDGDAIAASAVTEIQAGLSTLDAAGVRTAVGLASANLDTQIGTLATGANLATVDTVVDAIKAKTDSLAFTVAGQVDANVQYVNDVQVTGTGAVGDEWGP